MKIKFLLFFVLLAFSELSLAQILVGPTLGPQISWTSFDDKDFRDSYTVKPVVGFHAGVNLSFRVRKRFFLHSALLYSLKGKIITSDTDPTFQNKVNYSFIELPLLYTYEMKGKVGASNREFKWYLGAGPNISYWLGGRGTLQGSQLNEAHLEKVNYKVVFNKDNDYVQEDQMNVEEANRFQLGLNLSAGIVFEPARNQKVMLTLRYEQGHTFLGKNGGGYFPVTNEYTDTMRARNNGFRLSLAYLFDLRTEERKKGKSTIDRKKPK
ncbi:MAG: PorT family protein [Cyclobacteriaceae bacterium]|nr:PorT family protein [Cyclobacteriaceae bacterium]